VTRPLVATCVVVTAAVLPAFLVGALAVQIRQDLSFGTAALGFATAAFFGAAALSSFGFGRLAERLGPVGSMQASALLSALVLAAIAAFAQSYGLLVAMLAAGGLANGLAQPAANLYVARVVDLRRQGVAFAVKQSAIPIATLLGGLAVPAFGLTVGWRWAFVAGSLLALVGIVLVSAAVAERPARSTARAPRRSQAVRSALLPLSIGVGLGAAAAGALGTFFVTSGVEYGLNRGAAGVLAAVGGAICVAIRIIAGVRADRLGSGHLRTVATLLGLGAIAYAVMALGNPVAFVLVTPLAFGAGWGWPGLFNLAVVLANPDAPAAATGITQSGTYLGAMAGPVVFGWVAGAQSFGAAWLTAAVGAALAMVAIRLGRQRIRAARTVAGT
jgi:MFS family permease